MYRKRIGNVIFFPGVTELAARQAPHDVRSFGSTAGIPAYAVEALKGMIQCYRDEAAKDRLVSRNTNGRAR